MVGLPFCFVFIDFVYVDDKYKSLYLISILKEE